MKVAVGPKMSWVMCRLWNMAAYSNALLGNNHSQLHCSLIQSSSSPFNIFVHMK
jgi:hypothetical protein